MKQVRLANKKAKKLNAARAERIAAKAAKGLHAKAGVEVFAPNPFNVEVPH